MNLGLIEQLQQEFRLVHNVPKDSYKTLVSVNGSFKNDLTNVVSLVVNDIASKIPLARIEQKISNTQQLDFSSLQHFLVLLENTPPRQKQHMIISREVDFDTAIQEAKNSLAEILSSQNDSSHERLISRLHYGTITGHIDDVLYTYDLNDKILEECVKLVRDKVTTLKKDELFLVWSYILREFDPERMTNFSNEKSIAPNNFFDDINEKTLTDKIARYAVIIKPQITKARIAKNLAAVPADTPSVPVLLTLNSTSIERPTAIEDLIARLLSKMFYYWEKVLYHNKIGLAAELGLDVSSQIVKGMLIQDETSFLNELPTDKRIELIFSDLKKIALITDEYISKIPALENALTRYKLGLEVMLMQSATQLIEYCDQYPAEDNEKEFQKKLCKYLLDQGIYSFGKKFGRDEIDLITNENTNVPYVIETKIYRRNPTPTDIKKNLSQLQTYMDKEQPERHGILVLYNFSDRLVSVDNTGRWFKERYWILPINLGEKPASGTSESLIIKEGKGEDIIECYINK